MTSGSGAVRLRAALKLTGGRRGRPDGCWPGWLQAVDCPEEVKQDAVLVVSELVTNAITHTASAPRMAADYDDGRLRVAVEDHDPRQPTILAPATTSWLRLADRQPSDGWVGLPEPCRRQVSLG
jgi:Histidine kinase-like ATPase domain